MPRPGPRTPEGKAAVSQNGHKHGLRTATIVIPGIESAEEWTDFREGVVRDIAPGDPYEELLAQSIAENLWRLRRVAPAEAELIAQSGLFGEDDSQHAQIIRYEAAFSRAVYAALRALAEHRDRRALAGRVAALAARAGAPRPIRTPRATQNQPDRARKTRKVPTNSMKSPRGGSAPVSITLPP